MTPLKPYLIRALYQWINDNELTPYVLVDATAKNALLPMDYVENGKIVLNIRPKSIDNLTMGNEFIEFSASFSGTPMEILFPVNAVMGIFAKENNEGMFFDRQDGDNTPPPENRKANLRVIK